MILSKNTYNYHIIKDIEQLSSFFSSQFLQYELSSFKWHLDGLSIAQPHASNVIVLATIDNIPVALFAITQLVVVNEHIRFKNLNSILSMLVKKIIGFGKFKINVIGSPYKDNEPTILLLDKTISVNDIIADFLIFTKNNQQLKATLTIWSNSQLIKEEVFESLKFNIFSNDYTMILEINPSWHNLEDYKNALSKKYRVRINKLQAIKKFTAQQKFNITEIENHSERLLNLYQQVINNQFITLNIIDLSFFSHLQKTFGSSFNFFAYYIDNEIVGFRSTLHHGETYKTYFIGMQQDVNKEYQLYQQILLDSLEDAITLGCKTLDIGRTALEAKAILGAKPHIQKVYFKASNRIFQWIASYMLNQFSVNLGTEWQKRNPFKE